MIVNYKSNPEISNTDNIGLISLADNVFVFTTKITPEANHINYIKFTVCDETASKEYGFEIDPSLNDTPYNVGEHWITTNEFTRKEKQSFSYFNEVFQIKEGKLYKRVSNRDSALEPWIDYYIDDNFTYALKDPQKSNEYGLSKAGKKDTWIVRKRIVDGIKPLSINSIVNENINNEILFDKNSFYFDSEKWLRIIVSENAKLITFWLKSDKDDEFKKIKTFSYPGGIEKAGIKLSYDNSLTLSDISVSFFKTNVE